MVEYPEEAAALGEGTPLRLDDWVHSLVFCRTVPRSALHGLDPWIGRVLTELSAGTRPASPLGSAVTIGGSNFWAIFVKARAQHALLPLGMQCCRTCADHEPAELVLRSKAGLRARKDVSASHPTENSVPSNFRASWTPSVSRSARRSCAEEATGIVLVEPR